MSKQPLRQACTYAKKYKAIRPPTCGCEACETKWAEVNKPKVFIVMAGEVFESGHVQAVFHSLKEARKWVRGLYKSYKKLFRKERWEYINDWVQIETHTIQ